MGFEFADKGVSSKEETWCIAQAPTEVAVFKKEDFEVRRHPFIYSSFGPNISTARTRCW
jgi:hypothetical protein